MKLSTTTELHLKRPGQEDYTLLESIRFCAAAGFEALDISLIKPSVLDGDWRSTLGLAMDEAAKLGLSCPVCHLPYRKPTLPPPTEEELEILNRNIFRAVEAAAFIGAEWAVVHAYSRTMADYDYGKARATALKYLLPTVEKAAKEGVRLAIENLPGPPMGQTAHRYCSTPEEVCELVDYVGGDTGVCWDFGHANVSGFKSSEALPIVGDRLKVLHVNDNSSKGDEHVAPFMGTVDWMDAMAALKAVGFKGNLNFEVRTERMPESVRESYARHIIDIGKHLLTL